MAAKKKQTTAKQTKGKQQKIESPMKNEFISLFIIVAALLLGALLYVPGSVVGGWVRNLCTGLFGLPAYVLPLLMLAFGIHRAVGKGYETHRHKYTQIFLLVVSVSTLFQLFSGLTPINPLYADSIAEYWNGGIFGYGGGVIGGVLCDVFAAPMGKIAAGIILFTVFTVLVMILTKWSPLKALLRVIIRSFVDVKEVQRKAREEARKREEELAAKRGEPAKDKKRPIANFSDDEVIFNDKDRVPAVIPKPYDDDSYIPASIRDIPIDGDEIGYDFNELDKILDRILPEDLRPAKPEVEAGGSESDDAGETDKTPLPQKAESLTVEETEEISQELDEAFERIPYTYPDFSLLDLSKSEIDSEDSRTELKETATKLIATLKSFNVEAKLLNVSKGPTVTRYELKPGEGVKVSKIVGLSEDLALRLATSGVRIEAIPNKEAIGIEIPNKKVAAVSIREVLDSDEFKNFPSKLAFALGKDIAGKNVVVDLGKMPHLLIAGTTGSGKSVCINTLITSIIYKADPNEVKLLMVDPKVVELNVYNGIPHLMIPVVTDPRRASGALYWAVQEMTRRYAVFAENNVRDIAGYNEMILENGGENTMPYIVIIVDELADLMMVAPGEVEDSICRLAQMARAAGMHLVIATQRPSVDVITGLIKANVPSRISFAVSSQIDSRTILDASGAEKLLGRGDMLFSPVGSSKPTRLQGAFISDKERERVVDFIKSGHTARYDEDVLEKIENGKTVNISGNDDDPGDSDELLPRAIEIAVDTGKISASYLQRRLKIGFSRAARIVDQMEERGWIGPQDGSKPREVLISKEDYLEMSINS